MGESPKDAQGACHYTFAPAPPHGDTVELVFETPHHRPEIIAGTGGPEGFTYYQVMFASPDNLLFEVVYTGPKAE